MPVFDHLRDFKVVVSFYPIGSAPRLKVSKFTINGNLRMAELKQHLTKLLGITEDLHLYVHQSIEGLDSQHIGDFVKFFGKLNEQSGGTINVHYSIGRAYL